MDATPPFRSRIQLRWADIDANFHMRHSVYYDLGAMQRMEVLTALGVSLAYMRENSLGPVLLREECVFRREIKLEDEVWSEVLVSQLSRDHKRFSFEHRITKGDGTLCATLVVDGAWIDTRIRKMCMPPPFAREALDRIPRSEGFTWLEPKQPGASGST
ncbi:MAG: thioesterase family protein [Flavobacteriales bacterium]|nr:thioesterase family protein [Flavobacteriales bacterium]